MFGNTYRRGNYQFHGKEVKLHLFRLYQSERSDNPHLNPQTWLQGLLTGFLIIYLLEGDLKNYI